jgi:uncharacterized protein with von Willebrand factor type A (vWA) domain
MGKRYIPASAETIRDGLHRLVLFDLFLMHGESVIHKARTTVDKNGREVVGVAALFDHGKGGRERLSAHFGDAVKICAAFNREELNRLLFVPQEG